jgi:hypothetical protein
MRPLVPGSARLALLAPLVMLGACEQLAPQPETVEVPLKKPAAAAASSAGQSAAQAAQDSGATPMAQRVATLGLLNKRNNVAQDITLKPGEVREIGPVTIRVSACERTAPWEMPQEVGAFVQVDIRERAGAAPARVFSGWLFRESPSLNVVEHPVYDVWVKDCTMAFPGDDAKPAAKPSAAPAPKPGPTPSPAPTPAEPVAATD